MSFLATSYLFLKSEFTAADSAKITVFLKDNCEILKETRKGRHWEVGVPIGDQSRGFDIHVWSLEKEEDYWSFEDDMLDLNIDNEVCPEVIAIVSWVGRESDREACEVLSGGIAELFDCVIRRVRLVN